MLSYHLFTRLLTDEGDAPATVFSFAARSAMRGLVPHAGYVVLADHTDGRALSDTMLEARMVRLLRADCSLLLDLVRNCDTEPRFVAQWNALNAKLPLGVCTRLGAAAHAPQRTCLAGHDSRLRERIMRIFVAQLRTLAARAPEPAWSPFRSMTHDLFATRDLTVDLVDLLFESPSADLSMCVAELGGSRRTLQRHLDGLGLSFLTLRKTVRLMISKELLKQPKPSLTTVAIASGFYDAPHFCRAFRASSGMTPSDYRGLSTTIAR